MIAPTQPGRGFVARVPAALFVVIALTALPSTGTAQTATERLVGVYRLARYTAHGDEPIGRISYDAAGRMWAMIFPPGREAVTPSTTDETFRATMRGVIAYYGSYTIDEATSRVVHHVEAASNPAWIGDDFVRWYRFDGANLLIRLNARFDNPLSWERLPESTAAAGN